MKNEPVLDVAVPTRPSQGGMVAFVIGIGGGPVSFAITWFGNFGYAFMLFGDGIAITIGLLTATVCAISAHRSDRRGDSLAMRFAQSGIVFAVVETIALLIFNSYIDKQLM